MTTFYSEVEPFSNYSPVTLHLSPATRILNKNPASKGKLELLLGIPKKSFDLACSRRSDCGDGELRCEQEYSLRVAICSEYLLNTL